MRVLVVDDSGFMRKAITQMIASDATLQVVDTASNGKEAVQKAIALRPDVITLDIEMPVMDGMAALKAIRESCKDFEPAVLMCSSLTQAGSEAALAALSAGASDVIAKDASHFSVHINEIRDELIEKIKAIGGTRARRALRRGAPGAPKAPINHPAGKPTSSPTSPWPSALRMLRGSELDVIAIGSSTGGPPVLEKILSSLPAAHMPPIVVAQHMPVLFTRSMAQRLGQASRLKVHHAEDGMELHSGHVAIAQGGQQLRVVRASAGMVRLEVADSPTNLLYKPSVNELFGSLAHVCRSRCLGVVLTGMGDDGMLGAKAIRASGGHIVNQDADSCVVYGMPRAAAESGASEAALSPDEVIRLLSGLTSGRAEASNAHAA